MSSEEARREHSDPLADRTVAGVPGARSGHSDVVVGVGAGDGSVTDQASTAADVDTTDSADAAVSDHDEPLDLPADNPLRGYR